MPGKGKYKSKKRASHYEEKVAIDASFEDVIKIALNIKPEQKLLTKEQLDAMKLQKGSFILSNKKKEYPTSEDGVFIPINGFNAMKVVGTCDNATLNVYVVIGNELHRMMLESKKDQSSKMQLIDKKIYFLFAGDNGYITFEIVQQDKNKENYSVTIDWELLSD